jgi:hypothetical protein
VAESLQGTLKRLGDRFNTPNVAADLGRTRNVDDVVDQRRKMWTTQRDEQCEGQNEWANKQRHGEKNMVRGQRIVRPIDFSFSKYALKNISIL